MESATRPASTNDVAIERIPHLVDGRALTGASGRAGPVFDPARGVQTGQVPLASVEEVDAAVASARAAFEEWREVSLARRTKLMYAFRNLVAARADEIAARITAEHGKVLSDAAGEVARGLENIEFACGLAEHLKGRYNEQASTGVDVYTVRRPLGVVAGITPFNFPVMVPLWMLPNAVACGNTFILKPSERDPSAPTLLVELFHEAAFPPGVVNLVHGDRVAVDRLLEHPDVKAVSFVGSTPIARHVYETASSHGKRVQALGGAKNHMVVLPDADIDLAADSAVSAAYGSAGERCMAISVAVAVGAAADPLVQAIASRMKALRIGPGTDPASEMGPLVTREHRDRVAGYVETGASEGATVVVDGRESEFDGDGFFLGVTLLDHVTPDMVVYRDEIFGPVLCVVRVDSYHEAVRILRDNQWGNGAAIFTRDGGAARRFQEDADAGMVGINVPIPVPVGYHSFGGWKDSAFGDTTVYGPEGIHFYTRPKVMTVRWPDPSRSRVDLGFPTNR
ncbi:MAG: CoA-acylating methylmalonate-semialdehyde dehydrogenase [Gemmatimonadota bacterium]|nr:CoA-acylating methylmalonate-semialdehyde dehydrogenase [Gemmatimonadota bacterium]